MWQLENQVLAGPGGSGLSHHPPPLSEDDHSKTHECGLGILENQWEPIKELAVSSGLEQGETETSLGQWA